MLNADDILLGAYYALDQSGRLLADACRLYEKGCWPSSLVLAVFAFEELGKAETLYKRAIEAHEKGSKTIGQVMEGQTKHTTKLRAGRDLLTIDASVGFWGEPPDMDSPEGRVILARLAETQRVALKNAPNEAHQARMRSLYVDLTENGTWTRPADTTAGEAYQTVSAAAIQYGAFKDKFVRPENAFVAAAVREGKVPARDLPEEPRVDYPR